MEAATTFQCILKERDCKSTGTSNPFIEIANWSTYQLSRLAFAEQQA